jgi:hypothetical protein
VYEIENYYRFSRRTGTKCHKMCKYVHVFYKEYSHYPIKDARNSRQSTEGICHLNAP